MDGQEIKGAEELKKAAHNHFKNLLTANEETIEYENFLQHTQKKIREEQNVEMNKEISEEEVVAAIWSLHPDKAPGPNGFTIAFYKQHWKTIKKGFLKDGKKCFPKWEAIQNLLIWH